MCVSIPDGDDFPIYRQWTEGHSQRGWYSNAAVATDSEECSQVGAAILKRNGSVVDAGIAAMFCNSVHDQAHMGLGEILMSIKDIKHVKCMGLF